MRWAIGLTLLAALGAGGVVVVPRLVHRGPATVCGTDALQDQAVAGLATFADWLSRNHVDGYVGEVGWPAGPDASRWAALADTWYRAADAIGLPVTAWAAARWPTNYPMAVYRQSSGAVGIDSAGPQAAVVAAHPTTRRYLRGVVLAGGSFGGADASDTYSSTRPGRYGYDYSYENAVGYRYLATQGVGLVRLTVSWERLQPVPGQPLDTTELGRLRTALGYARQAGVDVLIDLHSYGQFALGGQGAVRRLVLGTPDLPAEDLADFWSRLARATRDDATVVGYDVLNEPVTLAARGADGALLWERASQLAVTAIRAAGSTATIAVSGYGETAPRQWGRLHPDAWISDPADKVVYEAHVYFDDDSSGHYAADYDTELRRAGARTGASTCRSLPDLAPRSGRILADGPAGFSDLGGA